MFLVFLALRVYVVLLRGIRGGSKYSSIGSVRGAGQALSYEVVLSIMVFSRVIFFLIDGGHPSSHREEGYCLPGCEL